MIKICLITKNRFFRKGDELISSGLLWYEESGILGFKWNEIDKLVLIGFNEKKEFDGYKYKIENFKDLIIIGPEFREEKRYILDRLINIFKTLIEKRNYIYELRFTGYNRIMNVPFLSGAFMFIRTEVLKRVGIFDERFFLYCDDLDLSRRIHSVSKTIYYPHCHIYHDWGRGSYKSFRILLIHVLDAIKYFNKWGWFKDKEREKINKKTLEELKKL